VKEQYVGDINDYRKYALLRRLASAGLKIGVCWMLTPPDGRPDGLKIGYLNDPKRWRQPDPGLFEILAATVTEGGGCRLQRIESSGAVSGATFFNEIVPDASGPRTAWFMRASEILNGADLVFFDPDNGLDVASVRKGRVGSSKFVYRDEIAAIYAAGHSILIYQHFPREARDGFIARLVADLAQVASGGRIAVFKTSNVAFTLVLRPEHTGKCDVTRVTEGWPPEFMRLATSPE